jgi:hypothetical protein
VFTLSTAVDRLLDKCKDLSFGNGDGGGNIGDSNISTIAGWCCLGVMGILCRLPYLVIKKAGVLYFGQGANAFVSEIILDDVRLSISTNFALCKVRTAAYGEQRTLVVLDHGVWPMAFNYNKNRKKKSSSITI